jgi:FkbM family methyltransferase
MILQHNKVFMQIGTNNGNDDFLKLVKRNKPSKIILVEPNKSCIPKIQNNYKGIENVFVENVAITKTDEGLVKLVIPKNKSVYGNPATSVCYSLIPMDDWGDNFHSIEAHSMTFKSLCEKHGLSDIHYLQIDTEGYDSEIIKSIDFGQISIDYIKYEIWPFEETAFTRHGEESKLYGANGMKASLSLLESAGYSVIRDGDDMVATKNT